MPRIGIFHLYHTIEDIKGEIRIRKSKKDRQQNGQIKKDKEQSTKHTHTTKDRVTRTPPKIGGELRCSGIIGRSCSTSGMCYFLWHEDEASFVLDQHAYFDISSVCQLKHCLQEYMSCHSRWHINLTLNQLVSVFPPICCMLLSGESSTNNFIIWYILWLIWLTIISFIYCTQEKRASHYNTGKV